ncbi:12309_t:CDS:2 [Acaulospora colombiana]|uniref:12309_t:CDS:1 n=1 Tax=Acaulospora colombiana TaxID=27376 RepID=A0ACA9KKA1_9GLOM|nr:12309_t:CDS:2 [Acaulospora colombiana]
MGSSGSKSERNKVFLSENSLSSSGENLAPPDGEGNPFRYIQGRRFHNVSSIVYDLPNDNDEGAWALEMATNYANSKFIGLDISPIFPVKIKPQNMTFQKSNILEGINYRYSDGSSAAY